jgi:hypothetical protein
MPAADVIGASWSTSLLALLLVSSCVLLAVLVLTVRGRLRSRARSRASPAILERRLDEAKREALKELDSLLARGLHTTGRTHDFYTASSGVVRRYAERLDARWGLALTSTELVRDLQAPGNGVATLSANEGTSGLTDGLAAEMSAAEVVKFGRRLPEVVAAEAHWRAIREWIEKSAGGTRGR